MSSGSPGLRHPLEERDEFRAELPAKRLYECPAGNARRVQAEVQCEIFDLLTEDRDSIVRLDDKASAVIEPLGQVIGGLPNQGLWIDNQPRLALRRQNISGMKVAMKQHAPRLTVNKIAAPRDSQGNDIVRVVSRGRDARQVVPPMCDAIRQGHERRVRIGCSPHAGQQPACHGVAFFYTQGPKVRPGKAAFQQQGEAVVGRIQHAHGASTIQKTEGVGLKARLLLGETYLEDGRSSAPKFDRCDPRDCPAMIEGGADTKIPFPLQLRDAKGQLSEPIASDGPELDNMLIRKAGMNTFGGLLGGTSVPIVVPSGSSILRAEWYQWLLRRIEAHVRLQQIEQQIAVEGWPPLVTEQCDFAASAFQLTKGVHCLDAGRPDSQLIQIRHREGSPVEPARFQGLQQVRQGAELLEPDVNTASDTPRGQERITSTRAPSSTEAGEYTGFSANI